MEKSHQLKTGPTCTERPGVPQGWCSYRVPLGVCVASHLMRGSQAPGRWMDESMCISHWVIDSPWVVFGWINRLDTQTFPTKGPGPEGTMCLLAGRASLHTGRLELCLSHDH